MFSDVASLHAALIKKAPKEFVSHFIFEAIPFAFQGDLAAWIVWKTMLAESLEVDPYDIVLTGSAAIGFSLNPNKRFKRFDDKSDFDCGVVSQYHFEVAWRYLRQQRPAWLSLPNANKRAIEMHRKNYVFSGTIATDSMLGLLPFGQEWQIALDKMSSLGPALNRDVKLRIYRDFDALRQYQARNIEQLRVSLYTKEPESPITDKDQGTETPLAPAADDMIAKGPESEIPKGD